jgi:hypothetical protein
MMRKHFLSLFNLTEKALLVLSAALRTACSLNSPPVWTRLQQLQEFQVATMLSNSRRITIRSCEGRYSLSGDSIKANTRRGVFRVKISEPSGLRRPSMTHAHSLDAQFLGKQV